MEVEIEAERADVFIGIQKTNDELQFFVMAEEQMLATNISTFSDSMMHLMSYHLILNLCYSAPNTFQFLQRALVNVGWQDGKPSKRVSTLLNLIKSL